MTWSTALPYCAAALALGYVLGSIPFGLIVTRVAGTADLRSIGSGNIGATNVLRTGRKGLAALTLLCDMLKGTAAVLVAQGLWGREAAMAAGLGAFLGHLFPIWLKFKGGKGVATYIGVLAALSWPTVLVYGLAWMVVAGVLRYSSLAALVACALTPVALWIAGHTSEALFFALLTAFVFAMHHANIRRLIGGAESKIGGEKA